MNRKVSAGDLIDLVAFDKRGSGSDGYGGTETAFAEQFQCRARIAPMRGGESVIAGRLEGRQTVSITMHSSAEGQLVTTDWRVRDTRSGAIYNIRDVNTSRDRLWIDLLCERGVAE